MLQIAESRAERQSRCIEGGDLEERFVRRASRDLRLQLGSLRSQLCLLAGELSAPTARDLGVSLLATAELIELAGRVATGAHHHGHWQRCVLDLRVREQVTGALDELRDLGRANVLLEHRDGWVFAVAWGATVGLHAVDLEYLE
ncbi:MAG: hypothetical protein H0T79_24135, partial [Deltaproteobacteria bacterium]|nr:hypothetical protein [Deltaproteobacteria bacterium]